MSIESIQTESGAMRFFRKIGMESIAWPLRRLYCPVDSQALVLEVGSGGAPYFRANVLCDAYEESAERFFAPLVRDRPMAIAFVENLPFKDNSFDFVIASHVLEHSAEPEKFLNELQRVAKAGYIEVPDAFMERMTHYTFHRLEITDKNNELIIRKKKSDIQDPEVVDLFRNKVRTIFPKWVAQFPFHFHVRYYWQKENGGIKFKVLNPECDANWTPPHIESSSGSMELQGLLPAVKRFTLMMVRFLFSQNQRNRSLDLISLLQCSKCHSQILQRQGDHAVCTACQNKIPIYLAQA